MPLVPSHAFRYALLWYAVLWASWCLAPPLPAQEPDEAAEEEATQDPSVSDARALEAWSFFLERDASLGFPRHAADALETLRSEASVVPDEDRRMALMALGCSAEPQAETVLRGWVGEGTGEDRQAAVLALGELGPRLGEADRLLVELLADPEPLLRECALLALLRSDRLGWRDLAAGIAADETHPLHADARHLLAFVGHPRSAVPPHRAVLRLLNLRWEAARRFGTVGGVDWGITLLDRLGRNQRFLDEVVLSSVTDVRMAGVEDHLLQLLLTPGGPWRVRAAVRVMPQELERLVGARVWTPENGHEWRGLLEEAVQAGVVPLLPQVIERATWERSVAPLAAALSVGRDERHEDRVYTALEGQSARLRAQACRGIGEAGLTRFLPRLHGLEDDPDPAVRAAALTARLRLGDASAREETRRLFLAGAGPEERLELRNALAEAGRSGDLTAFLAALAGELEGIDRADILAIVARRGRLIDGEELREAYPLCAGQPRTAERLIEALGTLPTEEDLAFLADLFPVTEPMELNVALARALIRGGHKKAEPLLRAAVWSGPFDRSLLAAAVVKHVSGLRTLQHWVLKPPPEATSADVRRVGYAIGEWGGVEAIEELQERMGGVAGADRPALQGAFLGAMAARTR